MKLNVKALINHEKEKPQICLIENIVPANEITLISAQKNSYKTFIGISLGLMYSTDEASKTGSETLEVMRTGGVMYLCLEGKAGFGNRVQSALSNDFYNDIGEWFYTDFDDETKNEFSHKWNLADSDQNWEQQAFFLLKDGCDLLIIDTLSKAMIGDENNQNTARTVVNNLYRIIKSANKYKRDLSIILIAHEGKDARSGTRGSSIFESDISTVLKIKKTGKLTGKLIVSKYKKLDAEGKAYPFRLRKDKTLNTLWVDWSKDKTINDAILDALKSKSMTNKELIEVLEDEWQPKFKDRRSFTTSLNGAVNRLFTRHLLLKDKNDESKWTVNA